jgi:hypothetical protein
MHTLCLVLIPFFLQRFDLLSHEVEFLLDACYVTIETTWPRASRRHEI